MAGVSKLATDAIVEDGGCLFFTEQFLLVLESIGIKTDLDIAETIRNLQDLTYGYKWAPDHKDRDSCKQDLVKRNYLTWRR